MLIELSQIWTVSGVLLGFQVTSFSWRIGQEVRVSDQGKISWIPPADYLNLVAMLCIVFGVFVAPVLNLATVDIAQMWFGLGSILFVGHSFALAGHYELFNNKTPRSFAYFPLQEKVIVYSVAIISIVYLVYWYLI